MADHQLQIDGKTENLTLLKDENGAVMYEVTEDVPQHKNTIFTQDNWIGGHGQYDFLAPDKYFEGQSIDTTQPNKVFLGPLINQVGISGASLGANPVCFCWFEAISKLMVATATKVFWYDGTNFVEKEDFAGKVIRDMWEFNKVLFVALDGADEYYYSADGITYTESTLTQDVIHGFLGAPNPAATASVLWGFEEPNEVHYNTVGTNAGTPVQWSDPPAYIGDTSNNITKLFLSGGKLMVGKEDNLYHYDSGGGSHPYMNDLQHSWSSNNFKYVTDWQSMTYCSIVTDIGEISSYNSFKLMGPLNETGDINKVGTCVGLASERKWLYAAIDEGTNTHIYKGREVYEDRLKWQWCPWVFLGANACATIKVCQHSASDRRLWFGYGNYAGYVILSDDPLADSSAKFAASGWIRMSYEIGTNEYWDELIQSIVTQTEACTANLTITPKYRKDTDTSATDLTDAITRNGVLKTNLTSELNCKRVQFELHFTTNSSSSTPELSYFEVRGVEKPETIRIHQAVYATRSSPFQKAGTLRNFLRDGRASTSLIRFADLNYGESTKRDFVYVVMEPGFPREIEVKHPKGKEPEMGIQVRLKEMRFE